MEEGQGCWGGCCYGVGENDDEGGEGGVEENPGLLTISFESMTGSRLTN